MPKDTRRRAIHERSVQLKTKRQFAVQENAVEDHVEVGQLADMTGTEILQATAEEENLPKPTKKKEKQALKHEIFLQRLESARSPYSKSHERRIKRKAREQVAGGMDALTAAISAVEQDIPDAVQNVGSQDQPSTVEPKPTKKRILGQIGQGKSVPLSKAQRKRALKTEKLRIPLILSNPEFASNPFKTIRTHAQNTLVKHEVPQ